MSGIKYTKKATRKSSPLFLILAGVVFLVVALVIILSRTPSTGSLAEGTPSLVADQQQINLGDVKLGQYVQASFQLTNTGKSPLKFTKEPYIEVREGC